MSAGKLKIHPVAVFLAVLVAASGVALLVGFPLSRITEITIYALYAMGVNLLIGYTGLVPFGACLFFGAASYAGALSALRLLPSEFFGIAFALVFSLALGLLVGLIVLRRGGLYFSLLTFALSQFAFEIALKWTDFTGGENGLQNVPRPLLESTMPFHVFTVLLVTAAVFFMWRLVHSPVGRLFQAIRDNEPRVSALGYDVFRYKLASFVLSSAFVGLAGGLLAFMLRGAYANALGWERAGDPLLMTIFGGVHHFLGPLWGAFAFIVLPETLSAITEHWWLIFGPIVIVFALAAPEGVQDLVKRWFGVTGWTLTRATIPPRPAVIPPFHAEEANLDARQPLLRVQGLTKRFGSLVVAGGIDFEIHPNRLCSLIGPNGAGKTTLFNMLTGILRPDGGTIHYAGRDVTRLPAHQRIRLGFARSFQIISLFRNLSAFESVRLAVQARSPRRFGLWHDAHAIADVNLRTWSILDAVGLVERADVLTANLSHGEQRLLDIAMALACEARLLLLDEPLAGLAEADRQLVGTLIRRLADSHAVVLIEHDIDRVLELSDEIIVLHNGALIARGKPREVAAHPAVIQAYLGSAERSRPVVEATPRASAARRKPLLVLKDVRAGYEGSTILDGLDLTVGEGEVVALLGRNGVGKTTTLRAITGVVATQSGSIVFDDREITNVVPFRINRAGIAMVPEGRRLFPDLTVSENLRIAQRPGGASLEEAYALLPKLRILANARAEFISGGERQMVAIARALMAPTRLVLLDEPFEGLAPTIVAEVLEAVIRVRQRASIVIVEHKAELVLPIADRAYVLVNGRAAYAGTAQELLADQALQARLLGVAPAKADHPHDPPQPDDPSAQARTTATLPVA